MRDAPPPPAYRSASPMRRSSPMRGSSPMRSASPLRAGEYTSTSTLLQEISTLRSKLRDLEEDTKSSVVSSTIDDKDSPLATMLRKDIATLEQEKAVQEKDFLNQLSSLQVDHQKRINDLHEKLAKSDALNKALNEKLLRASVGNDEVNERLEKSEGETKALKIDLAKSKAEIDDLNEKLLRSLKDAEGPRSRSNTTDATRFNRLLDEEREAHAKEMEQMKANLASADMEIAESRGEIDTLQEELFELQNYRETLLEEVTSARLDFSEEQRVSKSLKAELSETKLRNERLQHEMKEKDVRLDHNFEEIQKLKRVDGKQKLRQEIQAKNEVVSKQENEIGKLNDTIEKLETDKAMLVCQVAELKTQVQKNSNTQLRVDTSASAEDYDERPITPAEKLQIVNDMQVLESRLVSFHSKLADKDCQIDDLNAALSEERTITERLRSEINNLKGETGNFSFRSTIEDSSACCNELSFLRNQNKVLTEEVKALRTNDNDVESTASRRRTRSSSPNQRSVSVDEKSKVNLSSSRRSLQPSAVVPPPNVTRKTKAVKSPRTPVSGLVASFERRFGSNDYSNLQSDDDDEDPSSVHCLNRTLESVDKSLQIDVEVSELKAMLKIEKEQVLKLQEKLRVEKRNVNNLQEQLGEVEMQSSPQQQSFAPQSTTGLAEELAECKREVERLRTKVKDLETSQARRELLFRKEKEELNQLRSEAVYSGVQREDFEKKIKEDEEEIARLKSELQYISEQSTFQDEKKEDGDSHQIVVLREQVATKEEELIRLRSKFSEYEQDSEEALTRLKNQVEALQSELACAMSKIESLQAELDAKPEPPAVTAEEKKAFDDEIEKMELELTMAKARHAELESEHANKILTLENEISQLEKANADISMEVPAEKQKEFDDEASKLTTELTSAQMRVADLEMEHSIKNKDLEKCIKSLEIELEEGKKENAELMTAIERQAEAQNADAKEQLVHGEEMNKLTIELAKTQMERADLERESAGKIKNLEEELEALELEAESELQAKEEEVEGLRQTLSRKEEEIERLEKEKEEICHSMKDASFSRKYEMEELEAELLNMTTQTKSQAREIQSLKMEIEDRETSKGDASLESQRRIRDLEEEIHQLKQASRNHVDRDAILEIKAENLKLRESIRDVKQERRTLKERLESLTTEKSSSRSAQVLRDRNSALKQEVEKLTKRLKKMEASITRFAI